VAKVLVKSGDEIKVGQPYCVIEEGAGKDGEAKPTPKVADRDGKETDRAPASRTDEAREPAAREERDARKAVAAEALPNNSAKAGQLPAADKRAAASAPAGDKAVPAGPATRRLAREFGVDLGQVPGSGREGRVTEEDVKAYVRQIASGSAAPAAPAAQGVQVPALPKFEDWGPVDRRRLEPIRKQTARQMSLAWSLIPHVTQHDQADITDLDAFRRQQEGRGPKLTVTAFALKASAIALRQFPQFNASLDLAGGQLVIKKYYHVGVAVDTEHGLLVPVLRDVDRKSVQELAQELTDIAERARQKKLQSEEMRGGTFTNHQPRRSRRHRFHADCETGRKWRSWACRAPGSSRWSATARSCLG